MKNSLFKIAGIGLAFLIYKNLKKGEKDMDVVYATLIIAGLKTYADVPRVLKERVKNYLEAMDLDELVVE